MASKRPPEGGFAPTCRRGAGPRAHSPPTGAKGVASGRAEVCPRGGLRTRGPRAPVTPPTPSSAPVTPPTPSSAPATPPTPLLRAGHPPTPLRAGHRASSPHRRRGSDTTWGPERPGVDTRGGGVCARARAGAVGAPRGAIPERPLEEKGWSHAWARGHGPRTGPGCAPVRLRCPRRPRSRQTRRSAGAAEGGGLNGAGSGRGEGRRARGPGRSQTERGAGPPTPAPPRQPGTHAGGRRAPPSEEPRGRPGSGAAAMEPSGGAPGGAAGDPCRRPARRAQCVPSAPAQRRGRGRGGQDEALVPAARPAPALQEVAGRLPRADFRALCAVRGLRAAGAAAAEEEPPELTFRRLHARLRGYFGLSERIETRTRPRRRRRAPREPGPDGGPGGPGDPGDPSERLARLEEENGSLRELAEDLRAALQGSGWRSLARLSAAKAGTSRDARESVGAALVSAAPEEGCSSEPPPLRAEFGRAREARAACATDVRRACPAALTAVPAALSPQVGLWKSQAGALAAAEARAGRLRRGHAEARRRAEAARDAVLRSLGRVRELEALATQVPGLRRCVRRLEGELRRYRSEGTQLPASSGASPEPEAKSGKPEDGGTRSPDAPLERAWQSDGSSGNRALDKAVGGQLFRRVEGQAASDEEEEGDKRQGERASPAKVKALLAGLSGCRSGCDDQTVKKLATYFSHLGSVDHACAPGELEAGVALLAEHLGTQGCSGKTLGTPGDEAELQQKVEENEQLRLELQMVETERVRLSLLEEKLVDVLQLLQRLRDLNISKRALGKILLNTLEACKEPTHEGRRGPAATLDALHQALAGCELLRREPAAPAATAPGLASPPLGPC
ncbi:EF-hand and coiled-coil domain-containing protein 1 [Hyaena hyaena]|uniref:EF-hand and coiled-coil domain-containing protein 1 n=1 Tax=Hyaena hyaena TaxID=95912 RepID=UPI001921DBB1|nr:EF-hand and coiled-coil domain-containing protein 1 [Hyaena hyaena]